MGVRLFCIDTILPYLYTPARQREFIYPYYRRRPEVACAPDGEAYSALNNRWREPYMLRANRM